MKSKITPILSPALAEIQAQAVGGKVRVQVPNYPISQLTYVAVISDPGLLLPSIICTIHTTITTRLHITHHHITPLAPGRAPG